MLQTSLQQAAIDRWLQHGTRCTVASFRFWPKVASDLQLEHLGLTAQPTACPPLFIPMLECSLHSRTTPNHLARPPCSTM